MQYEFQGKLSSVYELQEQFKSCVTQLGLMFSYLTPTATKVYLIHNFSHAWSMGIGRQRPMAFGGVTGNLILTWWAFTCNRETHLLPQGPMLGEQAYGPND